MSEATVDIRIVDPGQPDVASLLDLHLEAARSAADPALVFALDHSGLAASGITLFAIYAGADLMAIGALKDLGDGEWEVKSMRAAPSAKGRGFGRMILDHLLAVARERGGSRVLLETGTTPAYDPANRLYASAGFEPCAPFADYPVSDFNRYYALEL